MAPHYGAVGELSSHGGIIAVVAQTTAAAPGRAIRNRSGRRFRPNSTVADGKCTCERVDTTTVAAGGVAGNGAALNGQAQHFIPHIVLVVAQAAAAAACSAVAVECHAGQRRRCSIAEDAAAVAACGAVIADGGVDNG